MLLYEAMCVGVVERHRYVDMRWLVTALWTAGETRRMRGRRFVGFVKTTTSANA